MSKLSQIEIDAAVRKSLNSLDTTKDKPETVSPYRNLIGTFNIKGNSYKHRLLRKLLSPILKIQQKIYEPYYDQQARVDNRILYISEELGVLQSKIELLPAVLSLDEKIDTKLYETQKLIDKFKKEILFELVEIKGGSTSKRAQNKPITKIINSQRVSTLKKLNIGCGTDVREDYINVDHRAIDGVDVVADVLDLPFKQDSLNEIFASHVAEHFVQKDLAKVIKYWFDLLEEGGIIRLIVPNIEDMAKRYANGEISWEQLRSVALGGQDYASDYHFNHFSVDSMKDFVSKTLPQSNFEVVTPSRKNGESYEMEVVIKK